MKIAKVKKVTKTKIWIRCDVKEPNVTESCLIEEDWEVIGFYLTPEDVPQEVKTLATMMNNELLSDRVPKNLAARVDYVDWVRTATNQFSTIIWAVKPEPFKRRYKPWLSHVHMIPSTKKYIQLAYLWADACERMVKKLTPELYERQKELLKWQKIKIGNLWTSSIANFNWAVNTHLDWANIKGANNIIYFKRNNCKHGNLHVPDYWLVIDSRHDSLVFYPAYKHTHWVDDIHPTKDGWYRNSIVLYPLDIKYEDSDTK